MRNRYAGFRRGHVNESAGGYRDRDSESWHESSKKRRYSGKSFGRCASNLLALKIHVNPWLSHLPTIDATMSKDSIFDNLPDVRDGLNRKERAILYCLQQTQRELGGRNVPTIMLYGRVCELVDISPEEFQTILSRFVGMTKLSSDENSEPSALIEK